MRSPSENDVIALLEERGSVKAADIARARAVSAETPGVDVVQMLLQLGMVSEADVVEANVEVTGFQRADPAQAPDVPEVPREQLSLPFLRQQRLVPVRRLPEGSIEVWTAFPYREQSLRALSLAVEAVVAPRVATPSACDALLDQLYSGRFEPGGGTDESQDAWLEDVDHLRDLASEAPVVRAVGQIIQRAAEEAASDIHVEPFEGRVVVRYRIDGVLQPRPAFPADMFPAVASRFKILSGMNVAEQRLPQDGRMQVRVQGREIDLRVSTVPTVHGESLVVRLLDRSRARFAMEDLGLSADVLAPLQRILAQPHGIFLVTGPTGSGKTTTLYSALATLNVPGTKILTVEDPVEYKFEGVNQIQVKPQIGLDFGQALRSILRQDPDVVLIGEMRDLETARIAIQAALTGHLVLSTLHTNSAIAGLVRLRDMGIENYLVASTVNGIAAQRLVRRLRPETRIPYEPDAALIERLGLRSLCPEGQITLYRAAEGDNGYAGRVVIAELIEMDAALRNLVTQGAPVEDIQRHARTRGWTSMAEDGLRKALQGVTSLEEVLRVASLD